MPRRPSPLDDRPDDRRPAPNARAAAMWRRYLHFWGPRADADVDEELGYHLDMRVQDYVARGMTEAEARDAVARRFGNLPALRARLIDLDTRRNRRMTRATMLDALAQDVRFGIRAMLRQKGWTAVGILTLALGIGANTAVFSVVDNLLLHPLHYPHADRLAVVYQQPSVGAVHGVSVYLAPMTVTLRAWREGSHAFEDLEGFSTTDVVARIGRDPASVLHAAAVQPELAAFAGQRPLIGRYFDSTDVASHAQVTVLSEALWRSRYGAADRVLGKAISLDGKLYTVIGVMPAAFQLPSLLQDNTDLYLPLDTRDDNANVLVIGRLRPGVTVAAAARDLDSVSAHMPGAAQRPPYGATVVPPGRIIRFRDSLMLLSAAVALVLIIACANVAHLLLARGQARQRELAIRAAIGAGRGRLFRQMVTESLLLAGAGGLIGIAVGWAGLHAIVSLRPPSLSQLANAHMNGTTLLVALGLAALTGVVFGVVGALQSARLASPDVLRVGTPTSPGRGHGRLRSLLVVTEMALSTTLLVGAALLIRSVAHLQLTDPGFTPQGLYSLTAELAGTPDTTSALKWGFYDRVAERLRALPGISGATVATTAPPGRNFTIGTFEVDGQPAPSANTTSFINTLGVRPGYFALVGLRFVQGGPFTDTTQAGNQVIVNEGMARKYWPNASALGRRVRMANNGRGDWLTIVGVVRDAATGGLTMDRREPMLYRPPQSYFSPTLVVRVANAGPALPAIRRTVAEMDAAIPPVEIRSVTDAMAESISGQRFTTLLLTVFTGLALLLAAIGLYGVMAYSVAQRTREIGVRMALGATAGDVARRVLREGLLLGFAGMALGLVGAHWGVRLLAGMLSGVTAGDALSFVMAATALLVTAVMASVMPVWRATRVDPLIAMRSE